jgi:hypothetical protein
MERRKKLSYEKMSPAQRKKNAKANIRKNVLRAAEIVSTKKSSTKLRKPNYADDLASYNLKHSKIH